ncbi:MAG: hypothetical protein HeimC3_50120 [Candidatus Heimdallarchaeota archaeon LC_3]|nr:MAG: hypothetical protein HeimC3_50120 [Candidatus Heimdallarchaeota archaeon LC_3]
MDNLLKYHHDKLDKAKTVEQFNIIINNYPMFDRNKYGELISAKAKKLIEMEHDLAYLEQY